MWLVMAESGMAVLMGTGNLLSGWTQQAIAVTALQKIYGIMSGSKSHCVELAQKLHRLSLVESAQGKNRGSFKKTQEIYE